MADYDETDDIVDEARERIAFEREALAEFAHNQHVTWDRYAYVDESDWRTHGGLA